MTFRKCCQCFAIVLLCFLCCFEDIVAPRPQLSLRPVLKGSPYVPPSLPIIEGTLRSRDLPRESDLRVHKLRKKLGDEFNPTWSSIEQPTNDGSEPEFILRPTQTSRWIESEIGNLTGGNRTEFPDDVVEVISDWFRERVTCPVLHEWVDIGPLFWPRYVKHGQCVKKECSWPRGMECFPSDYMIVKLLRWHCRTSRDNNNNNRERPRKNKKQGKRCNWLNVPYSVMVGCSCECSPQL